MSENGKILLEAHSLINGKRQSQYGPPQACFNKIARLWSTYLEKDITRADVANLMILLKIARQSNGTGSRDSYVDIAGYAGLAGDMARN